jgi:hypothetical protein
VIQAGGILTGSYLVLVLVHALGPAARPVTLRVTVPWYQQLAALSLALCSLLLGLAHWGAYLSGVPRTVSAPNVADVLAAVLVPAVAGGVLATLLGRFRDGPPDVASWGRVGATLGPARRVALAVAAVVERIDAILRQWAVAGLALLVLAVALGATMLARS